MKTEIEGKGKEGKLFFIGKSGKKYSVNSDGLTAHTCMLLFEQDLFKYVMECLNKSVTADDITSHANFKYPVCGSGLMEWAVGFQKILHSEHTKNCKWILKTVHNKISNLLTLTEI